MPARIGIAIALWHESGGGPQAWRVPYPIGTISARAVHGKSASGSTSEQ